MNIDPMVLEYLFDYADNVVFVMFVRSRAPNPTDIFICGSDKAQDMHDSESDTFHPLNKNEEFCETLKKIGIDAKANPIDSDDSEKESYYSKNYTNSPAMVTNHGTITLKGTNIDVVQIIQRG